MELIDINGIYQWDNTIFDNMVLPTDIVKADLIDMIIWECRELTVTVVSPTILKRAIELWSKKNIYYWTELQDTMHYTYNPIENYDKHSVITNTYGSTITDKQTGDVTNTQTGKETTTNKGTRTTTNTGTETTTDALTRASYDSNTELPRETHTITHDLGVGGMVSTEDLGTDGMTTTVDYGSAGIVNKTVPNTTNTNTHTGVDTISDETHGNIGVMSTQQMIEQQRNIIDISLYNIIVNSFKNEFCILKY